MNFGLLYGKSVRYAPNTQQVIFINQDNNQSLNDFFEREYEKVVQIFKNNKYDFIFLPKLITTEFLCKLIAYNHPELTSEEVSVAAHNFNISSFYDQYRTREELDESIRLAIEDLSFFDILFEEDDTSCYTNPIPKGTHTGLLRIIYSDYDYSRPLNECPSFEQVEEVEEYLFSDLHGGSDEEIWAQLNHYIGTITGKIHQKSSDTECLIACNMNGTYASLILDVPSGDEVADYKFPKEAFQLSQDIIANVEKLRSMGINEMLIMSLFLKKVSLSRLTITKDYRFVLSDYQDREIKIGPLPKAIYLLFLRHPEGIIFKEIADYRQELFTLYQEITGRESDSDMRKSIIQATDPSCNSINENCSRIRQAFLKEMDDDIAKHYYITGERATPKGIKLDRSLVIMEKEIL